MLENSFLEIYKIGKTGQSTKSYFLSMNYVDQTLVQKFQLL